MNPNETCLERGGSRFEAPIDGVVAADLAAKRYCEDILAIIAAA
jgi:hypothetical protein